MTAPDLLTAALDYADRGLPVFPCHSENKRPLTPNGFHDASTDRATVADWWKRWPMAMIGLPTGAPSGVWVLDIDDPDAFAAKAPTLPTTRKAITGKGYHLYWQQDGGEVRNAQRHPKRGWPFPDLPGAEVRGDGGYVILPPSRHPSGRLYQWAEEGDPVPAPADLLRLMTRQTGHDRTTPPEALTARPARTGDADSPYGLAALQRESEAIFRAANGEQESALNEAALKMGALVAGGELSLPTAKAGLTRAGLAMPSYDGRNAWTTDAITAKVERGLNDGAASPRSAPPRDQKHSARFDPETGELPPTPEPAEESADIEPLDLAALARVEPRPKGFVIPALAPAGEVTLFTGPGSAGKSLWAQQVATALAAGVPTLGLDMGQGATDLTICAS